MFFPDAATLHVSLDEEFGWFYINCLERRGPGTSIEVGNYIIRYSIENQWVTGYEIEYFPTFCKEFPNLADFHAPDFCTKVQQIIHAAFAEKYIKDVVANAPTVLAEFIESLQKQHKS